MEEAPYIYERTVSILKECKEVWPLATRWVENIEVFERDGSRGTVAIEGSMSDGKDTGMEERGSLSESPRQVRASPRLNPRAPTYHPTSLGTSTRRQSYDSHSPTYPESSQATIAAQRSYESFTRPSDFRHSSNHMTAHPHSQSVEMAHTNSSDHAAQTQTARYTRPPEPNYGRIVNGTRSYAQALQHHSTSFPSQQPAIYSNSDTYPRTPHGLVPQLTPLNDGYDAEMRYFFHGPDPSDDAFG